MYFIDQQKFVKIAAFLRYLVLRIYYRSSVRAKSHFFIGKKCTFLVKGKGQVDIIGKFHMHNYSTIKSYGHLIIGERCSISLHSRIVCYDSIELGDRVVIAQYVTILDHDHSPVIKDNKLQLDRLVSKPVKIGDNVWIGDKVTITKGVSIGDNVIIGANSVVTKSFPSNCIIGGIPAKILKILS